MYRQDFQRRMEEHDQFLTRIGNLPVVYSALGQVNNIYERTKGSNRLMKYTLETAECSVKTVANKAQPVVSKFEGPITKLSSYACMKLDSIEENYPLITKPTDEVTKQVYGSTLKPTVDRVNAVTQYGVDTAVGVKNYGVNKVSNMKQYSTDQLTSVKSYGCQKANDVLNSKYGQSVTATVISTVDVVLDTTERYVDYYLPEKDGEEDDEKDTDSDSDDEGKLVKPSPRDPWIRATQLGGKLKHRMYARSLRNLQYAQKRSRETLNKLNFTVDLIQYAKNNIDSVQTSMISGVAGARDKALMVQSSVTTGVVGARDKMWFVWDEINKTEDEVVADDLALERKEQSFEARVIATARHLTLKLKRGFHSITEKTNLNILPTSLSERLSNMKSYTENLYQSFKTAETFNDLSTHLLEQTTTNLGYIQDTLSSLTDYTLSTKAMSWLAHKKEEPTSIDDSMSEEIEMEDIQHKDDRTDESDETLDETVTSDDSIHLNESGTTDESIHDHEAGNDQIETEMKDLLTKIYGNESADSAEEAVDSAV